MHTSKKMLWRIHTPRNHRMSRGGRPKRPPPQDQFKTRSPWWGLKTVMSGLQFLTREILKKQTLNCCSMGDKGYAWRL